MFDNYCVMDCVTKRGCVVRVWSPNQCHQIKFCHQCSLNQENLPDAFHKPIYRSSFLTIFTIYD